MSQSLASTPIIKPVSTKTEAIDASFFLYIFLDNITLKTSQGRHSASEIGACDKITHHMYMAFVATCYKS